MGRPRRAHEQWQREGGFAPDSGGGRRTPALREGFPLLSTCTISNSNAAGAVPARAVGALDVWFVALPLPHEIWLSWWSRSVDTSETSRSDRRAAGHDRARRQREHPARAAVLLVRLRDVAKAHRHGTTDHEFPIHPSSPARTRSAGRGRRRAELRHRGRRDAVFEAIDEQTAVVIVSPRRTPPARSPSRADRPASTRDGGRSPSSSTPTPPLAWSG